MTDYISIQKNCTDQNFWELLVTAENPVIRACSKIYVTQQMLMELQEQIDIFLAESDLEGYWENDVPGIGGPPCVTLKFLPDGTKGRVLAEIYMELNDGGSFMDHHCSFFVRSDRTLLQKFSQDLTEFYRDKTCIKVVLNG